MCARYIQVPGDGNCQFSAIADSYGGIDAGTLRERVVRDIEANTARYYNYLGGEEMAQYLQRMGTDRTYGDELFAGRLTAV
ncbi:hypothetical protein DIPPA_05566 [Diplonema papillatum]|nr:hypothetical protein DIPPA_05566 [Diplonema papillatum]